MLPAGIGGIRNKWVRTPIGSRRHQWGDNQSTVTYTYSAYQRDVIGTESLLPGRFGYHNGVAGQFWRCWYFPGWYYDEFWPEILRRMRGKPLGPNVWVRDSYWDNPGNQAFPQFRVENYDPGNEDYTNLGDPEFDRGYNRGYAEGHAIGLAEGKKKAKGKGKGKGKCHAKAKAKAK